MSMEIDTRLQEAIECLLFVANAPVALSSLAQTLDVSAEEAQSAIEHLASRLAQQSGLQIVQLAGGYQLCTKAAYANIVARFLQPSKQRLSKPALETLAIIAYRQPITLPEVEDIRGVSCEGVLKSLVEKRLIREAGRKNAPGRPMLYATTPEFLHQFGLKSLDELPAIEELKQEVSG